MHLLSEDDLANLWRVYPTTPRLIWKLPFFDAQNIDDRACYSCTVEDVDEYMRSVASGFNDLPVPSVAELLTEGGLLNSQEAYEMFGLKHGALFVLVHKGEVPAFRIGPETYRYPATLLAQLVEQQSRECIDVGTAAHILGISQATTSLLATNGPLRKTRKAGGGHKLYVTRESHDSLLRNLLPSHMTTEVWWEERLLHRQPMWGAEKIGAAWHLAPKRVRLLLDERRLPYIMSPGGNLLVPNWIVAMITEERRALTPAEIKLIFGISPQLADEWVRNHVLCKNKHGRAKKTTCPSQLCVATYLSSRLLAKSWSPEDWIRGTLKANAKAIGVQTLLSQKLSPAGIAALAKRGTIQVLELPNGDHVVTRRCIAS